MIHCVTLNLATPQQVLSIRQQVQGYNNWFHNVYMVL